MPALEKTRAAMAALMHPGSAEFAGWAAEFLEQANAEFSSAFEGPEDPRFLRWVATHGRLQNEELIGPYYPPLPPAKVRETGCFGASDEIFLTSGLDDVELILSMQEIFGDRHLAGGGTVLDFGSGAGRALRWLARLQEVACFGSDVLEPAVRWCASHLEGRFLLNGTRPPLELADDSVDLAYALSIFSHFGREASRAWMAELARVTRPGGLILVTTHGAFALAVLTRSEEHQRVWGIDAETAVRALRELENSQHVFVPYADSVYEEWSMVERDQWGQAFLNERFARSEWGEAAELLGTVPAALGLIQDLHCLRPR